jgi:hypothetical protein
MNSLFPPYVGYLLAAALIAAAGWGLWRWRVSGTYRAWRGVAEKIGGTLENARPFSIRGRHRGYAAFLQEAVSYEDAVAYRHTRGALNVMNPACAVMGLRRKSVLEEFTTRRDARPVETGDADFDRAFFLLLTVPEHVGALLTPEVRRVLRRYSDVEVYLRSMQIEWRRAGTLSSERDIMALFDVLADMTDALKALPARSLTLSQRLADEALIEGGI